MKKINFIIILLCLLVASCKGKKDSTSAGSGTSVEMPAPEWVGNRPHSPAYYIGVGSCSKFAQPYDYQTIAKKNALNDMASEISVRVQGQTFLNSLEVNRTFTEEFISNVSTSSDAKIEDYEIAGTWENKNEFWVYYRLNKSTYQSQKLAKKSAALNLANDFYQKGISAQQNANVAAAFDLYMRGIFALKEYWNESNEYQTASGTVYLDNEIFSSMQRMCGDLQLKVDKSKVTLSSENRFSQDVLATLMLGQSSVKGLTVKYSYEKSQGPYKSEVLTTEVGHATVPVNEANFSIQGNAVTLEVDLSKLKVQDLDQKVQDGFIQSFKTEKKIIPIEAILPSFYITSVESNYGNVSSGKVLQSALSGALVNKGLRISGGPAEADYLITIDANTKEGGQANGFVVAFLEMNLVVKSRKTGEVAFSETLSSVKGLQLNRDAASIEAYKKGKERIEQQIISKLTQAIL
ncbi:MAG: LPP20 family lipoprotein [Flavobacteriales bacterium]